MTVPINWLDLQPKTQIQKLGPQNERKRNTVNIFEWARYTWNTSILTQELWNGLNSQNMWPCLSLHFIAYYLPHILCLRRPKPPYSILFPKFMFSLVPLPLHTFFPHTYHSLNRSNLGILQCPLQVSSPWVCPNHSPTHPGHTFIWALTICPHHCLPPLGCKLKAQKSSLIPLHLESTHARAANYKLFQAHSRCSINICWAICCTSLWKYFANYKALNKYCQLQFTVSFSTLFSVIQLPRAQGRLNHQCFL